MNKKVARTFMPEIMAPGTGLSPLTDKSIMPAYNVPTILDVLNGDKYQLPDSGGAWGRYEDDLQHSYMEDGDAYKREERFVEILQKNSTPLPSSEKWVVEVPGGKKIFDGMSEAIGYSNYLKDNKKKVLMVRKIAQNSSNKVINDSLDKTFKIMIEDSTTMTQSTGSAFCVADNVFLTCAHVVKKYNKNKGERINLADVNKNFKIIMMNKGKVFSGSIIAINEALDLALISCQINCEKFVFSKNLEIGSKILAIGSPHEFENNITFGNINSVNRKIYNYNGCPLYFFFDANVFSGNSGGPIVDANNGHIMGIVTAVTSPEGDYGLNAGLSTFYIEKFLKTNKIEFITD